MCSEPTRFKLGVLIHLLAVEETYAPREGNTMHQIRHSLSIPRKNREYIKKSKCSTLTLDKYLLKYLASNFFLITEWPEHTERK